MRRPTGRADLAKRLTLYKLRAAVVDRRRSDRRGGRRLGRGEPAGRRDRHVADARHPDLGSPPLRRRGRLSPPTPRRRAITRPPPPPRLPEAGGTSPTATPSPTGADGSTGRGRFPQGLLSARSRLADAAPGTARTRLLVAEYPGGASPAPRHGGPGRAEGARHHGRRGRNPRLVMLRARPARRRPGGGRACGGRGQALARRPPGLRHLRHAGCRKRDLRLTMDTPLPEG